MSLISYTETHNSKLDVTFFMKDNKAGDVSLSCQIFLFSEKEREAVLRLLEYIQNSVDFYENSRRFS